MKKYYPFSAQINGVYALVVVYQEAYLDFSELYSKTAFVLGIHENSSDFKWLWKHVGLVDVATLERYMLTKTDVLPEMMKRTALKDGWLNGRNEHNLSESVLMYKRQLEEASDRLIEKLYP